MAVTDSVLAAQLTAEQVIAATMRVPGDDDASSTVIVTQSWRVSFALGAAEDASEQAAKLQAACQVASADCTLVSSQRRTLSSTNGITGSAVLSRLLTTGNLATEIDLGSSGVVVTDTTLQSIDVLLSVTKQGGAEAANALLTGILAEEQVRATVVADLGLAKDALFVDVQQPIFPPMPPPLLPPSPLSPPPTPPPPSLANSSSYTGDNSGLNAYVIVGCVAAGILLAGLTACGLWLLRRQ